MIYEVLSVEAQYTNRTYLSTSSWAYPNSCPLMTNRIRLSMVLWQNGEWTIHWEKMKLLESSSFWATISVFGFQTYALSTVVTILKHNSAACQFGIVTPLMKLPFEIWPILTQISLVLISIRLIFPSQEWFISRFAIILSILHVWTGTEAQLLRIFFSKDTFPTT